MFKNVWMSIFFRHTFSVEFCSKKVWMCKLVRKKWNIKFWLKMSKSRSLFEKWNVDFCSKIHFMTNFVQITFDHEMFIWNSSFCQIFGVSETWAFFKYFDTLELELFSIFLRFWNSFSREIVCVSETRVLSNILCIWNLTFCKIFGALNAQVFIIFL